MAKLKIKYRFGIAPVVLLNDPKISLKAKGLYAFIQSKPDGWDFSALRISKQTSDGVDSVSSGLQELEKHGLLIRHKTQNKKGHWEIEYVLMPEKNPDLENPSQENPDLDFPALEIPALENHPNNSKRVFSKNQYSKEEIDNGIINNSLSLSVKEKKPISQLEKNKDYIPIAKDLAGIVTSSKNINIPKSKINNWANSIRLLNTTDGVSMERIETALQWYEKNHGGDYIPVIESGQSLRSKFLKLEAAIQRSSNKRFRTQEQPANYTPREQIIYRKSRRM